MLNFIGCVIMTERILAVSVSKVTESRSNFRGTHCRLILVFLLMRRFFGRYAVSSEKVAKNVLAKIFKAGGEIFRGQILKIFPKFLR